MKRGRPKYFTTGKYVFVIHSGYQRDKVLSYHLAESPQEAVKQAKGGTVLGKISPAEYVKREPEYQAHFKSRYEKES